MKHIYILLSKTGTLPSRFIHRMTGGAFTHASVALIPEPNKFYSYGRRRMHNIFNAGVINEDLHARVFALYPDAPCALYELEVTDEAYQAMKKKLAYYMKNYKKAKYDFVGTLPLRLGIKTKRRNQFKLVCSQFVALILQSGEIKLPKDPYLMLPNDFEGVQGIRKIYDGALKNCKFNTHTACPTIA